MRNQLFLAHRGYCGVSPENTELAFDLAHQFGFDGVELDIHLTKDNQLVIIHDETTKRTAETNLKIQDSTLAQLRELNYAKCYNSRIPSQKIMTLEEFLDKYINVFKMINIEIKTDDIHYQGIEELIHKLIQSKYKNHMNKLVFSSFNFKSLQIMYELDNKYILGFLYWRQKDFNLVSKEEILKICQFLHPSKKLYKKYKKEYQKLGLKFNLWTIKTKKSYDEFKDDEHVHSLISNYLY
ncbi:glycerophosphodiester phosphodiesterase family protein [Mycoplasmopsis ciconiae]|uniref:Glycerophosphodiester phosphodiesterase family protein n=1 Tax=Mycoplasmopsis ciconiae TaxID=561067 RepID=A0ABU7ML51_9BACT|nr:glycerophosphodiester phosphodiesterase family protein [Mycoplasmopsis ciconiae]